MASFLPFPFFWRFPLCHSYLPHVHMFCVGWSHCQDCYLYHKLQVLLLLFLFLFFLSYFQNQFSWKTHHLFVADYHLTVHYPQCLFSLQFSDHWLLVLSQCVNLHQVCLICCKTINHNLLVINLWIKGVDYVSYKINGLHSTSP